MLQHCFCQVIDGYTSKLCWLKQMDKFQYKSHSIVFTGHARHVFALMMLLIALISSERSC